MTRIKRVHEPAPLLMEPGHVRVCRDPFGVTLIIGACNKPYMADARAARGCDRWRKHGRPEAVRGAPRRTFGISHRDTEATRSRIPQSAEREDELREPNYAELVAGPSAYYKAGKTPPVSWRVEQLKSMKTIID